MSVNVTQFHQGVVHSLRADFAVATETGVAGTYTKILGAIPAGSIIQNLTSGVYVYQVYNAGTNNLLDIGTADDPNLYGTSIALGTVAFVAMDEAATATGVNAWHVAADTTIQASVTLSSTTATTGKCVVVVNYIPPPLT